MQNKKVFGQYIAQKRKEAGLTQAELASALFITVSAVSKWERGVTYPDITMITELCKALGVDEHELLEAGNDCHYSEMKSDFPPCSKFVKKYKALTVSLTFLVSLNLLLLACCLYTRSDCFFISFCVIAGVLRDCYTYI